MSFSNEFLNFSIQEIGFTGAARTYQHLTVKPVKRYISFDNFMMHNLFAVLKHHFTEDFSFNHI